MGLVWTAALIFMDQRLKVLMEARLKGKPAESLIPGILGLSYVENAGMAFGMFQNGRVIFILLTAFILIALILLYHAIPEKKRFFPLSAGAVLIFSGAVGNLIDRIRLGYVIDYLNLEFMNFPVFNLADCFVTWTAVVLMILFIFVYKDNDLKQIHL